MPRVRLIHWKAAEASALLATLRAAGYQVDYDEAVASEGFRGIPSSPPDAFVIDLSRLPSHGREVAVFFRGRKSTRAVPIVFLGGDPQKVAGIRAILPDASYAQPQDLRSALRAALANRPADDPIAPPQMMQRYATRTVAQKLGITRNAQVALIDPPRNYAAALGQLPSGAALEETPAAIRPVTLWFVHDAPAFVHALPAMRKLAPQTKLWIVWRKGSPLTQTFLRESAAAVGLVDYKICAVNEVWSAMLFARRKPV